MKQISLLAFLFLIQLFTIEQLTANESIWLYIDTEKLQLEIKQGNKTLSTLHNIAIGRGGAGFKQRIGDEVTPLGTYKIAWVNNKSPFYRFFGLNYPSENNANQALSENLLDKQSHHSIINAHKNNQIPPQSTKIGGRIGIHGLGNADKSIHNIMNWTRGCIALNNEQIDQLVPWISKNMQVVIK